MVTVGVYLAIARVGWKPPLGESVIGSLCSAYVNAGNLGIPIALYVLGDISLMAPTLLLQLLVITPTALALLDADRSGHRPSLMTGFRSVTRNPITIAALAGVLLSLAALHQPRPASRGLLQPVQLVGNMAVPAMLIAFGISLRRGPKPGAAGSRAHVATLVGLKLVFQPIVAIARRVCGGGAARDGPVRGGGHGGAADRAERLHVRQHLPPRDRARAGRDLRQHVPVGAGDPADLPVLRPHLIWPLLAGATVHALAEQVGVAAVPGVLLDHVQEQLTQRDRVVAR